MGGTAAFICTSLAVIICVGKSLKLFWGWMPFCCASAAKLPPFATHWGSLLDLRECQATH